MGLALVSLKCRRVRRFAWPEHEDSVHSDDLLPGWGDLNARDGEGVARGSSSVWSRTGPGTQAAPPAAVRWSSAGGINQSNEQ